MRLHHFQPPHTVPRGVWLVCVYRLFLTLWGNRDKKSLLLVRWMVVTLKEAEATPRKEARHSKRENKDVEATLEPNGHKIV